MKPTELLVATGNAGKLREIRALLSDLPITLVSLADFPTIEEVLKPDPRSLKMPRSKLSATLDNLGFLRSLTIQV